MVLNGRHVTMLDRATALRSPDAAVTNAASRCEKWVIVSSDRGMTIMYGLKLTPVE